MHAQGIELGNYPPPPKQNKTKQNKTKQNKTKQNPVGGQEKGLSLETRFCNMFTTLPYSHPEGPS